MRLTRFLLPVMALLALANTAPGAASDWRRTAERNLATAAANLAADTNSPTLGWEFARACFDVGEYATNTTERAAIAKQGNAAARRVIARYPASAPAHYYLGMNLGQLARTRLLSALKLVNEMEREFLRALELDPNFDYAGPDRNLGLLYREAPSIGSVGNRRKAQHHLQAAVKLAPNYPENRLNLAESFLTWGNRNGAAREFKALEECWAEAEKALSGPAWEPAWVDWETRRKRLAERLRQGLPGLKSPRDTASSGADATPKGMVAGFP